MARKSVIVKPSAEEGAYGGFVFTLASIADDMVQWGSDVKGRDAKLRAFWPSESILASALYAVATRNAAFQWTLDGPPQTVETVQDMLLNASDGSGWIDFVYRWSLDYLTQDNGAHIEMVRLTDDGESPVVDINNLDSKQCRRTGVLEWPVIYTDRQNRDHKLTPAQVYSVADMPSPIEAMNGVGFCAVSRILRMAQYIRDLVIHDREKISGADPKRLYIVGNVGKKELETAMQTHKTQMLEQGYVRYIKPVILPILDPSTPPAVATLDLAVLPEGFNKDNELKWYVTFVALALGVDYQDLAPLASGNLGTASQSQVLHLKSKGKGAAMFQKRFAHMMNFSGILPRNVTFRWDEQDIGDEIEMANLKMAKANTHAVYINTGVLTPEAVRQILLDEGEIGEEIFNMIQSQPDLTPEVTVTDQEEAEDQQSGTETLQEDQKGGPGSGHFDHEGRPGEVGGSLPGSGGLNPKWEAHNRLQNEGREGYNPHPKYIEQSQDDRTKRWIAAMDKRDRIQRKLAYGDISDDQRTELTAQLHAAQAELDEAKQELHKEAAKKARVTEKPPPKMARLHMKLEHQMAEEMDDGLKKVWRLVRERIFGTKQKVLTSPADLLADADLWKQIRDILLGKMQGISLNVATSVLAANQKLGLAIDMDRVNTVLLEYTRNYSNEWWSKLEESTRDGLREALTTWEQQGLGTRGFPDLVKALEPYFGESRAHNIAMTETTKLLDESNRLSEMSAGITQQKWYTSMDSRVCDICEPLNGKVFPIDSGPYPVDDTHIGCRCERIGIT